MLQTTATYEIKPLIVQNFFTKVIHQTPNNEHNNCIKNMLHVERQHSQTDQVIIILTNTRTIILKIIKVINKTI